MRDFFNCVFVENGMAFGTGFLIFLFALFLAANRIIGFTLTLLFLVFALAASLSVANQEAIRNYFSDLSAPTESQNTYQAGGVKPPANESKINAEIQKAFDDLKNEVMLYEKKLEDFINEYTGKEPAVPSSTPPPTP